MDTTHGHPLEGGYLWRDGYQQMFSKIHNSVDSGKFITTEGGCDFLANEVDGFMVQGWESNHLVPAFSVVYAGKVQLFGTLTGSSHYGEQRFYGRPTQGFCFGSQTGRQSIWLTSNLANANDDRLMAANFVKSLAKMRHKLKYFMSFGEMKHPLSIAGSIPEISFSVYDYGITI